MVWNSVGKAFGKSSKWLLWDPEVAFFEGLSDLQAWDQKVTLNLVVAWLSWFARAFAKELDEENTGSINHNHFVKSEICQREREWNHQLIQTATLQVGGNMSGELIHADLALLHWPIPIMIFHGQVPFRASCKPSGVDNSIYQSKAWKISDWMRADLRSSRLCWMTLSCMHCWILFFSHVLTSCFTGFYWLRWCWMIFCTFVLRCNMCNEMFWSGPPWWW